MGPFDPARYTPGCRGGIEFRPYRNDHVKASGDERSDEKMQELVRELSNIFLPRQEQAGERMIRFYTVDPEFTKKHFHRGDCFRFRHYEYDILTVPIEDSKDVTLEGVTIYSCLLYTSRSRQILVKNVVLDWNWDKAPLASVGVVTQVAEDGSFLTCTFPEYQKVSADMKFSIVGPFDPARYTPCLLYTSLRIPASCPGSSDLHSEPEVKYNGPDSDRSLRRTAERRKR